MIKIKVEYLIVIVPCALFLMLIFMAVLSKEGRAVGLVNGRLASCPDRPNCICSEYPEDQKHYLEPLSIPADSYSADQIVSIVVAAIVEAGGKVQIESRVYISAVFESRFLGFADDFEVRVDWDEHRLYFRSASRVGYSDFGINRARAEGISELIGSRFVAY